MPIVITQYNPQWKSRFRILTSRIWPHVSDIAMAMEHVGSTSVVGLAAKPVIDADIVIDSEDILPEMIRRLDRLGYSHRGDQGVPHREAFWCRKPAFRHHLYVCLHGYPSLRNHLELRNHLRENSQDRLAYERLKRDLAASFPNDIDSYVEGKTDFILRILRKRGILKGELSSMDMANRNPRTKNQKTGKYR